jgi:hypothetical protein
LCKEIRTTGLEKGASDAVLDLLEEEVNKVMEHSKLIEAVGVEAMKQRHWAKVFDLLKEPLPPALNDMKLDELLDFKAMDF